MLMVTVAPSIVLSSFMLCLDVLYQVQAKKAIRSY